MTTIEPEEIDGQRHYRIDGTKCPTCGRDDFDSEKAMLIHHSQSHDESLAVRQVKCDKCGTIFERHRSEIKKAEKHYCSRECQASVSGEDHPNYGRERSDILGKNNPNYVEKTHISCTNCGGLLERVPSEMPEKGHAFCDHKCRGEYLGDDASWVVGESNYLWRENVVVECEWCGSEFLAKPSTEERRRACSRSCSGKLRTLNPETPVGKTGKENPGWKGGISYGKITYGPTWERNKKKVLKRDQHRCQRCGKTSSRIGQEPDVHHVVPFRVFGINRSEIANRESNLISLCRPCHREIEQNFSPIKGRASE